MTEAEANDLGIYLDKFRYGFMIMDASQCCVSQEGEFATRYYGAEGRASRQPYCSQEFATKEAALEFIDKNLAQKAREARDQADEMDD